MGSLIDEILARLRAIAGIQFVSVYNDQFEYVADGESWSFPWPCAFAEVLFDPTMQLGNNHQGTDVDIKIHIGQNVLNGDLIDENLTIFALRDLVVIDFSTFKPTTGGLLQKVSEAQDFQHTNIYHYTINFKAHWIDTTAVPLEYFSTPPTALKITKP